MFSLSSKYVFVFIRLSSCLCVLVSAVLNIVMLELCFVIGTLIIMYGTLFFVLNNIN